MLNLHDLSKRTKEVTVTYDGESFTVTYFPHRFTPAVNLKLSLASYVDMPLEEAMSDYAETIASVIKAWEIMDGTKPWPVTKENIAKLPDAVLMAILEAIRNDRRPNAPSAAS